MKTGRLIRIGFLFAFSIAILFWGINYLKGKKFFQEEKTYFAEYTKIGGLTESSPVTINGFNVGKVRQISITDFKQGIILVKFVVDYPNLEIPLGSEAKIISTDLMGTKAIEIILADSDWHYPYEDTLPGLIEGDLKDQVNKQMLPLKKSAEDLMASMDSVLISLRLVFGQDNRDNLAQSFEGLTQTFKNLEEATDFLNLYMRQESERFSSILNNAESISTDLNSHKEELDIIITNMAQFSDTLKNVPLKDVALKLNILLSDLHLLFEGINQGEGNLGKLNQDDSLYYALKSTTENLNYLINDIRLNPKRYIHFSAFDRGQTIIASTDSDLLEAINNDVELEYFVCLLHQKTPLPDNDEIFTKFKKLSFIYIDNIYYYYIDKTTKLDKGKKLVLKNIPGYPNAGLFTFLNNKWHQVKLYAP